MYQVTEPEHGDISYISARNDKGSALDVRAEGIALVPRRGDPAAAPIEKATVAQRPRRLRRKLLAQKVVEHWKQFAREGIAHARARTYAGVAPQRRALARWRSVTAAVRVRHFQRTADAGRRRYLAESRALITWAAVTRASRDRRRRSAAAVSAAAAEALRSLVGRASAARALRRWRETVAARRAQLAAGRTARAHHARAQATFALYQWCGLTQVADARRGVEGAALRAWAAGRLHRGLASLKRQALKGQLEVILRDRAARTRERLLGLKGIRAFEAFLLRAAAERDVVAEAEAGRARTALRRWQREALASRMRRAARTEQAHALDRKLTPSRMMRTLRLWGQFCASRRHFRRLLKDLATVKPPAGRHRRPSSRPVGLAGDPSPLLSLSAPAPARVAPASRDDGNSIRRFSKTLRHAERAMIPRLDVGTSFENKRGVIPVPYTSKIALPSRPAGLKEGRTNTTADGEDGIDRVSATPVFVVGPTFQNLRLETRTTPSSSRVTIKAPIPYRRPSLPPPPLPREGHVAERGRLPSTPTTARVATERVEGSVPAGRACALASLRRWRQKVLHRKERREAGNLAKGFRDHVLMMRYHESWKAFARQGRAAAAMATAVTERGRLARMRRSFLGFARGVEVAIEEREAARPLLRLAFGGWQAFVDGAAEKRERYSWEEKERHRSSARRLLRIWSLNIRARIVARQRLANADDEHRRRCLRVRVGRWKQSGADATRRREQSAASQEHVDRRRFSSGLRTWRGSAARMALSRTANERAREQASKALLTKMLRAWKERADLQAVRKAVFDARVASATVALAESKLRRYLGRWVDVHGSARVVTITRMRADGHARTKTLKKFWEAWGAAVRVEKERKAFRKRVKARHRLSLQRGVFAAIVRVTVAARRERERVTAALILWKLHTQGKAFAALAAHCIRRRMKKERARRAAGWRRERLIKEGAIRWAATADGLVASRISSAAFREGNAAARRWQAAGRCARHWRRIAAARAMERRTLGREPGGGISLGVAPFMVSGAAMRTGVRPVGLPVGRTGIHSRSAHGHSSGDFRSPTVSGVTVCRDSRGSGGGGKENLHGGWGDAQGHRGLRSSSPRTLKTGAGIDATAVAARLMPKTREIPSLAYPPPPRTSRRRERTVPADSTVDASDHFPPHFPRRSGMMHPLEWGVHETVTAVAGTTVDDRGIGSRPASSWRFEHSEKVESCDSSQFSSSVPIRWGPAQRLEAGFEKKQGDQGPRSSGTSFPPTNIAEENAEPALWLRSAEKGAEHVSASTTTQALAASDLAQAAPTLPSPPGLSAETLDSQQQKSTGSISGRRRPAPRRPLELLLDETPGYASYSSAADRRDKFGKGSTAGGATAVTPAGISGRPPLSAWVVDEMNRLFGVHGRSHGEDATFAARASEINDTVVQGRTFNDRRSDTHGSWVAEPKAGRLSVPGVHGNAYRPGNGCPAGDRLSSSTGRLVGTEQGYPYQLDRPGGQRNGGGVGSGVGGDDSCSGTNDNQRGPDGGADLRLQGHVRGDGCRDSENEANTWDVRRCNQDSKGVTTGIDNSRIAPHTFASGSAAFVSSGTVVSYSLADRKESPCSAAPCLPGTDILRPSVFACSGDSGDGSTQVGRGGDHGCGSAATRESVDASGGENVARAVAARVTEDATAPPTLSRHPSKREDRRSPHSLSPGTQDYGRGQKQSGATQCPTQVQPPPDFDPSLAPQDPDGPEHHNRTAEAASDRGERAPRRHPRVDERQSPRVDERQSPEGGASTALADTSYVAVSAAVAALTPAGKNLGGVPEDGVTDAVSETSFEVRVVEDADTAETEGILEARVAEAERRLLALQQKARQRRRDKRELAALHQALALKEQRNRDSSFVEHRRYGEARSSVSSAPSFSPGDRNDSSPATRPRSGSASESARCIGSSNGGERQGWESHEGRQQSFRVGDESDSVRDDVGEDAMRCSSPTPSNIQASPSSSKADRIGRRETRMCVGSDSCTSMWKPSAYPEEKGAQLRKDRNRDRSASPLPIPEKVEVDDTLSKASRVALLVRMGVVRARLESSRRGEGGKGEGGELHPGTQELWREVKELARSGGGPAERLPRE